MAVIGTLDWIVRATGAQEAQGDVDDFRQSVDETAESTESADEATSSFTGSLFDLGGGLGSADVRTTIFSSSLLGLNGRISTLIKRLAGARAASLLFAGTLGFLTTVAGLAKGALTTVAAALAGPAGIAGAIFLAVAGIGALGAELLGITDKTGLAKQEVSSFGALVAETFYLIGGPLAGFLGAAWKTVTGDFKGAKEQFVNTSVNWVKAAARFAARVKLGIKAFSIAVVTGIRATIALADEAWRLGWNDILQVTQSVTNDVSQVITDNIQGAVNVFVNGINKMLKKANQFGGDFELIDDVSLEAPETDIAEDMGVEAVGYDERIRQVRNRGRRELERAREETQNTIEGIEFRGGETGGSQTGGGTNRTQQYADAGSQTSTGGQTQVQNNEVNVEVGDQSLNLSDVDRRNAEQTIGEIVEDKLQRDFRGQV